MFQIPICLNYYYLHLKYYSTGWWLNHPKPKKDACQPTSHSLVLEKCKMSIKPPPSHALVAYPHS